MNHDMQHWDVNYTTADGRRFGMIVYAAREAIEAHTANLGLENVTICVAVIDSPEAASISKALAGHNGKLQ